MLPTPAEGPSRILVVGSEPWWTRSIQSIFEPDTYAVFTATSGARAIQHVEESSIEAAIVQARLSDGSGVDLIRNLRDRGLGDMCPVILISGVPLPRHERVDAMSAGAWDCLTLPADGEEVVVKLETFLRARRVANQAGAQALLDEASGLYNLHGILRWARELGHAARRYHRPFGCAVFAPVEAGASAGVNSSCDVREIASRLTSQGRASDVIGRLSLNEYVVLAPETGPQGIRLLARRFVSDPAYTSPTTLRAGCYAVPDLANQSVEPTEVIARAILALRHARAQRVPDLVEFFEADRLSTN